MTYRAFISYSHQDNRRDRNAWADWLHDAIETFKVPPELVGKPGRYGEPVPARLYPSFQDEKELPTNADLGESIRDALRQSRYLVVICSPLAAKSVYVNQEILEFKRLDRANRILAIIVDGEPNASDSGTAVDPSRECFPPALRHPLGPDGNLDLSRRAEPIAADTRGADGKEISLNDKAHYGALEREKLRVIAGVLGVGFDDLVQRDKERQLRDERARAERLRKLVAAFAMLALAATVAGVIAILARQEAQRNLLDARQRLAQIYVERAEAAYAARDASQQAVFLAEARVLDPAAVSAPVVEDLAGRTAGVIWSVLLPSAANALAVGPGERTIIVGTDEGRVVELETATGKQMRQLDTRRGPVLAVAISPDGSRIATG
ncbi:MAG TPA: TIR domain-containing protein, partial [Vicinamibacterales bacterium]